MPFSTTMRQQIWAAIVSVGMFSGLLGSSGAFAQGPPANTPGQPVAEIQALIAILNDKIDALQEGVDNLPGLGPCDVPPVWGKTYATVERFVPVLGGAAFCDKATGLVWEGSPDTNTQGSWQIAIDNCTRRVVGGVKGFHLPLIEQITSLLPLLSDDLNSATGDGPFTGVWSSGYWSATTRAFNPTGAWHVNFSNGDVLPSLKGFPLNYAWCVRGGQAYDGQDVEEVIEDLS